MAKYLTLRLTFVFLCTFFYYWAYNISSHLVQFFDSNDGFILHELSPIFGILILAFGLFTVNLVFSILNLKKIPIKEFINNFEMKGFVYTSKFLIALFLSLLIINFEIEKESEKYQNIFIACVFIFLFFSKGNPLLNNYYGIYKEYEVEGHRGSGYNTIYIENQNYIIHKSNKNEIKGIVKSIKENIDDDETDFEIKKRGYLFVQAGIIDGYSTNDKEYSGFLSYVECLLFFALEKLIITMMYFFIPFLACIIYHKY